MFGCLQVMELELKKLQDRISSIHDEMFYLRERLVPLSSYLITYLGNLKGC